jgi:hypothetical protein
VVVVVVVVVSSTGRTTFDVSIGLPLPLCGSVSVGSFFVLEMFGSWTVSLVDVGGGGGAIYCLIHSNTLV